MRVLIVGGGVAGLETLLALRDLGGDRLDVTLVADAPDFTYKPMTVDEPFTHQPAERLALEPIAAELGARFVRGSLARVLCDEHAVELSDGAKLSYEALVVCIGGRSTPAYAGGVTFDAAREQLDIDKLIETSRGGELAFVVPPGVTWPLPIYELALMTDRRARAGSGDPVQCVVVTPEPAPLSIFGEEASAAVTRLLTVRGIETLTGVHASESGPGEFVLAPGERRLVVRNVIALPMIIGPRVGGLPADDAGFIPIDEHARVRGLADVYAAGDGTDFPIKQGGIATQQADAAAMHIAARAGADVEPRPFRPVLRGKLLIGEESLNLRSRESGAGSRASDDYLWWPPHKISGRYLAAWLAGETPREPDAPRRPLEVEVALPHEWHSEPMALDPYGPLDANP